MLRGQHYLIGVGVKSQGDLAEVLRFRSKLFFFFYFLVCTPPTPSIFVPEGCSTEARGARVSTQCGREHGLG